MSEDLETLGVYLKVDDADHGPGDKVLYVPSRQAIMCCGKLNAGSFLLRSTCPTAFRYLAARQ